MDIQTSRFGRVEFSVDDAVQFPEGLPGLTQCRDWVFLADLHDDAVAWMQSVERPEVALAVVSPRRFLPDYQLRVARRELEPLGLGNPQSAEVLVIVGRTPRGLALNLRAPLVIDLQGRRGRQVIANGDLPLQYELPSARENLKRTA